MHPGSGATRKGGRIDLLFGLFSWAVRKNFVKANPVFAMETIRVTKKDPEILTVDQCRTLTDAAKEI